MATFVHELQLNLDANIQTDVIFLDFTKEFDKVRHARLLLKLSKLNFDPAALAWIGTLLHNRKQFVNVNNYHSDSTPVISGVPQGSLLGLLISLIFINDLPAAVSSHIRLFADDSIFYRAISNPTENTAPAR